MHTPVRTLALVSLLFGCLVAGAQGRSPHRVGTPGRLPVSAVSQLPLSFEPNRGQAPSNDSWLARSAGIQVGFSRSSFRLVLPSTMFPQNLGIRLLGANKDPRIVPSERTGGESNYLLGNQPSSWKTRIPQYARLTYGNVYPGVDVTFYETRGRGGA
jgi:hypothetical protein